MGATLLVWPAADPVGKVRLLLGMEGACMVEYDTHGTNFVFCFVSQQSVIPA